MRPVLLAIDEVRRFDLWDEPVERSGGTALLGWS
jgi:hypothetical protein